MTSAIVVHEFHPTIPLGEVIRTDPPNLTLVPPSQVVTVYVSDGPVPSGVGGFPAVSRFGGLLQGANV